MGHNAWVRALRSENDDRLSRASEASETDESAWIDGQEEMQCGSFSPMHPSMLTQSLAMLELDRPVDRGVDRVEASGGDFLQPTTCEHGGGEEDLRAARFSAVELAQAQWLAAHPPLLTRQSAPLPFRLGLEYAQESLGV